MHTHQERIIKKAHVENKILQILYLAEVNLECCKTILNYFEKYRSDPQKETIFLNLPEGRYLTLCLNNHFFEAVELISGLLYPSKEKGEISFILWEKIGNLKISNALQNIKDDFEKKKFLGLRHNFIAHKNIKISGDPEIVAILPIGKQMVNELKEIIQKLKQEVLRIFKNPVVNNYLLENREGLKNILEGIQPNIDRKISIRIKKFLSKEEK